MSYDLDFLPPEFATDTAAVHAFLQGKVEPPSPSSDRKSALAAALIHAEPSLTVYPIDHAKIAEFEKTTIEQARAKHNHLELNGPEGGNGIQITLFTHTAAITVPYWHEEDAARRVFDEIERYADVLVKEGPFRIYDPQLNRLADRFAQIRPAAILRYGGVVERVPEIAARAIAKK